MLKVEVDRGQGDCDTFEIEDEDCIDEQINYISFRTEDEDGELKELRFYGHEKYQSIVITQKEAK